MVNSRVSGSWLSPPALACFTTKRFIGRVAPRSTCRNKGRSRVHQLSVSPPVTLPFTAFSGPVIRAAGQAARGRTAEREVCRAVGPVDLELEDPGDGCPAVRWPDDFRRTNRASTAGSITCVVVPLSVCCRTRRLRTTSALGRRAKPLSSRRRPSLPPGCCPSGAASVRPRV